MSEWQPIETAPISGRWVLVWNGDLMCVASFYGGMWCYVGDVEPFPLAEAPSHWMPLPDKPLDTH